ncbi:MAG: alpha-L-arabinofuranosidase C-terminal domain-containing protein, partial [Oscillospiraceae bacterium]
ASSKICVSGTNYKEYSFTLNSSETMQAQTFSITSAQEGTVCFGFTSLFPEDTFCKRTNGLRKDLAERVQALNPAFLRYPGGCIVEGMNRESIMHFHHTIGPIWERPSQYLLWGYRSTNGFGFDEFMQFCEDLNAVGLYVINAGMSCQGRNPHYAEPAFVKKLAQETLDMLEYALGGTETTWGKLRAQNGHSHQYPLKYLEIGNENFGKAYQKNYEAIYQIIKPVIEKYYPGVEIIANEHREKCTLPCDIIDEHYYSNREFFAMNADYYDNYPRNQQVYIGEYAVTRETTRGDLVSACGEAAFLIGAERNQDVVKMTSYAPMFANEGHINWQPDLIRFSSGRNTVIPFYYVLEAFGQNRGENVIGCDITTEDAEIERSNKITLEGISADVRINDVVQKAESNGEYCGSDKDEYRIHILISEVNEHGRIGFCANNHFNQDLDGYFLHYDEGHVQLIYWNGYSRMLLSEAIKCKLTANMNIQIDIRRDKFIVKLCGENLFCYNFKKMPKIVASATATQNEIMIKCVNTQSDEQAIKLNFDTEIQEAVQYGYLTEYGFIWRTIKIENNFIYKMKPYEIAMIRASKK